MIEPLPDRGLTAGPQAFRRKRSVWRDGEVLINGYWEAFYVWTSGIADQCAVGTATLADPTWYQEYPCPEAVGELTITGIDPSGMVISFTSTSQVTGTFHLGTHEWIFSSADRSDGRSHTDFTLLISVARKDPFGSRLEGARVAIKALNLEVSTDANGLAGPFTVVLPTTERFPYDIEVGQSGFKTCVVRFGSMLFPDTGRWWEQTPHRLFVYLPAGEGMAAGDECYGGRTQPQTPGK